MFKNILLAPLRSEIFLVIFVWKRQEPQLAYVYNKRIVLQRDDRLMALKKCTFLIRHAQQNQTHEPGKPALFLKKIKLAFDCVPSLCSRKYTGQVLWDVINEKKKWGAARNVRRQIDEVAIYALRLNESARKKSNQLVKTSIDAIVLSSV